MISVNRIVFNKFSSQDFDLICDLAFDGDGGETDSFLTREAVESESYRGEFKRVHNYKYTESFAPKFTFIKKDFEDFTFEEQRRVIKWLTSTHNASFLTVYYDDSEVVTWEALGGFTEITTYKIGNGRTVGFVVTFESVNPYALSELHTITKDVSNPTDNIITINLETDEPQSCVYPRITVKQNNVTSIVEVSRALTDADQWLDGVVYHYDGTYYWVDNAGKKHISATNDSGFKTTGVAITNKCIDENQETKVASTRVINNIIGETVVLDGANKVISSSRTNGRIFGDDFDWSWMPLFEGINTISVIGNCTVTLEWRTPIKCGEY